MKQVILTKAILTLGLVFSATAQAQSYSAKFELTITNGSLMPISPGAIYAKVGAQPDATVGSAPSAGFIQLCQTGNPVTRVSELKSISEVKFITQTTAPILPGDSKTIIVDIPNINTQSLHFEAMYGKTKDVCSVGSINSHSLVALKQHAAFEIIQKDEAVLTGAFETPAVPAGSYSNICATAKDAISCLRELSEPVKSKASVRFFAGYLPSLVNVLEMKYGVADVQTLIIPTSGAVQFKLKLKH